MESAASTAGNTCRSRCHRVAELKNEDRQAGGRERLKRSASVNISSKPSGISLKHQRSSYDVSVNPSSRISSEDSLSISTPPRSDRVRKQLDLAGNNARDAIYGTPSSTSSCQVSRMCALDGYPRSLRIVTMARRKHFEEHNASPRMYALLQNNMEDWHEKIKSTDEPDLLGVSHVHRLNKKNDSAQVKSAMDCGQSDEVVWYPKHRQHTAEGLDWMTSPPLPCRSPDDSRATHLAIQKRRKSYKNDQLVSTVFDADSIVSSTTTLCNGNSGTTSGKRRHHKHSSHRTSPMNQRVCKRTPNYFTIAVDPLTCNAVPKYTSHPYRHRMHGA